MQLNPDNTGLRLIYDEMADRYEAHRGEFDMGPILEPFFCGLPRGGGHLLDLGCGAGEPFPAYFLKHGWEVTGVDFSRRMLELAHRYVPQMQTCFADIREVDFAAGSFDAITCIYSFFHLPRQSHPGLFERFQRWLRPGGKLLFTYATQAYTGCSEFDGIKEFMGHRLFYSHTTPERLRGQLEAAGLEVEEALLRDIGGESFLWVTATPTSAEDPTPVKG